MKITRYPQSCLLIEKDGKRIVIDPGSLFAAKYKIDDLGDVSAVFYTHIHPDHCDETVVAELQGKGIIQYANQDIKAKYGDAIELINDLQTLQIAGFEVEVKALRHRILSGVSEPINTGLIIDKQLLHPGDSADVDIHVPYLAVPILGVDISPKDAVDMIARVKPQKAILIHYDFFEANPLVFSRWLGGANESTEIVILENSQSIEV